MGFLRYDSPLMRLLGKAADLMWLNILCLLCSLPVFTIGASFTAMQTIFYRLLHNEDVYVTREFFGSVRMVVFVISLYVFPIISRYENTTKETLKNACIIAISHPIRSIIMLLVFALCIFVEIIISFKLLPVLLVFCISVPFYFCSMVYMPIFDKLDGVVPGQATDTVED